MFYVDSSSLKIAKKAESVYKTYQLFNMGKFIAPALKRIIKATGQGARSLLWLGGVRSLKTSSMMQLCGYHVTGVYPGENPSDNWQFDGYKYKRPVKVLVVSLTNTMSRDITQAYLTQSNITSRRSADLPFYTCKYLKSGVRGAYEKLFVPHFTNGVYDGESEVVFKSAEEGASSFQGFNYIDCIFIDEEPKYDVFKECLSRLAGLNDRKTFLFLAQWPVRGKSEVLNFFLLDKEKDAVENYTYYTQSGWGDNPFLSSTEKKKMETDYPSYELPARRDGVPVYGTGRVFEFDINSVVTVSQGDLPVRLIAGIDPSVTSNGVWGGVLLEVDNNGVVTIVNEYCSRGMRMDEHANALLKGMLRNLPNVPIICDPAGGGENDEGLSAIKYLKWECGLNIIPAYKANKAKNFAIDKIMRLQREGLFRIHPHCVNTVIEMESYARDENQKIIKKNDHIIDALLYAITKLDLAVYKENLWSPGNYLFTHS